MVDEPVDPALLTPLTGLQKLHTSFVRNDPLDLSLLTRLTKLVVSDSPVSRLPPSLVKCKVSLLADFDFSPLANLTWLSLWLEPDVTVTFPTGLRELWFFNGELTDTNIGDVALESFYSMWTRRVTRDELDILPKTLKSICGCFEPASLMTHLREMFPLLERSSSTAL